MTDTAQITRSLGSIRTELEYLRDSGVLSVPQFESIIAQLPQKDGQPSRYVDPRYNPQQPHFDPGQLAQQAQDPANAAHPANPNHHEWAKNLASKFGNAAMFGAGATFGGDMVNDALRKL